MQNKETLLKSLELTLQWFENSGVMFPADGTWGVAERIVLKENNRLLERIISWFPPINDKGDHLVLEQRRADCAMQTALLYSLAAEILQDSRRYQISFNLLEFLFCRSGLLRTATSAEELPIGIWQWSHSRRYHQYYFDDNSWMCALMLIMADRHPEFEKKFQLRKWALLLADAMCETFPAYLSGVVSENTIKGDMKWLGNVFKPHWGSLVVMALSRSYMSDPKPIYRKIVDEYHDYLLADPEREIFNTSEWAYACIGASFAFRAFKDEKSAAVLELFGGKLAAFVEPDGLLPSQHSAEAPAGEKLADLIYTMNFASLALGSLAHWKEEKFQDPFNRLMQMLLKLQDLSPAPHLYGCRRGMFNCETGQWGGGNCSEGGADSIYTGWTNAPIAIAVSSVLLGKTLEEM